jgi:hypothetical protein
MLRFRLMPLRTCAVTLTDARGVKHTAEVTAETLYEAAILGIQILKKDGWIEGAVGAATRIEIEVREPATRHTITLMQIERWLSGATISPNERVRKDRLKGMLQAAPKSGSRSV